MLVSYVKSHDVEIVTPVVMNRELPAAERRTGSRDEYIRGAAHRTGNSVGCDGWRPLKRRDYKTFLQGSSSLRRQKPQTLGGTARSASRPLDGAGVFLYPSFGQYYA